MYYTYVRRFPESVCYKSIGKSPSIALIDLVPERLPLTALGDRFRQLDPAIRALDAVVVRLPLGYPVERLTTDKVLRREIGTRPFAVLQPQATNDKLRAPEIHAVSDYYPLTNELDLASIREFEVAALLETTGAIVRRERAHFLLPCRTFHASTVIRIKPALRDPINVSRLADWVLPFVSERTALLADTSDLLPLLMHVSHTARLCCKWDIPLDVLQGYPYDGAQIEPSLRDLTQRGGTDCQVILILSVNATGGLSTLFERVAHSSSVLTLCDTSIERTTRSLTHIPTEMWPVDTNGQCAMCNTYQRVVLDPRTLETVPVRETQLLKPTRDRITAQRAFWVAASESKAVSLHRWEELEGSVRHYPIFVDLARLLRHEEFRRLCVDKLRSIPSPDLVLIPSHGASDALRSLITDAYSPTSPVIAVHRSGPFPGKIARQIGEAKQILIADDALVTGATVLGLRYQVYACCQNAGRSIPLDCFVCLCRPQTPNDEKAVGRPFFSEDKATHFHSGVCIYMPGIGQENCVWCKERERWNCSLQHVSGKSKQFALDRIAALERECSGAPLLCDSGRVVGSLFGELDHATAFAAAASVCHTLCAEADLADPFSEAALDLPFVIGSYFDGVLLAGLLRTCAPRHVRYSGSETAAIERLESLPWKDLSPAAISEFLWAAVEGKLPQSIVVNLARDHRSDGRIHELCTVIEELAS